MRGFESGKDFARNFRDTLANMFRTLVLRPVVQAIVNPVAMAITGGLGVDSASALDGRPHPRAVDRSDRQPALPRYSAGASLGAGRGYHRVRTLGPR